MAKSYRIALLAGLSGLALVSGSAQAQSSVTLYGILDSGVEFVSHASSTGGNVVRMPSNTGEFPSRWGLQGSEDIGSRLQIKFVLESGIYENTGGLNQGGRLFGRQAWVGINSPYGLLSFGRQYTMTYWALEDADITGPDVYGLDSLDAYIANARSDNTIAYKGTFHGLTIGATYSFGRDAAGTGNSPGQGICVGSVPGDPLQCRQWSALLKYDSTIFGVAAAYDEQRGGEGAAANLYDGDPSFALTSSGDKDARAQLNGYIRPWEAIKFSAGWIGRRVTTVSLATPGVSNNLYYIGASYQVIPSLMLDGEVSRILNHTQDARATRPTIRATYFLSKRTAVYAQAAYLINSSHAAYSISAGGAGNPPKGDEQTAVMLGMRHLF
ncbi:porin [Paraburkholderia oxyphila]|uniref:porin n=1 Tax=Paraburkholderia oxyphila TaxID=614212 RepID=UPI0005BAF4F2|nr:porin [Paraburkholderia oxyphila]